MQPDGELCLSRLGEEIEKAVKAYHADHSPEAIGALENEV